MSDNPVKHHAENAAHHVKAGGKGLVGKLKGHNKYVYIAGAVVLIGIAWLAWHRSTSAAAAETSDEAPDDTMAGYSDPGMSPSGGFGGSSDGGGGGPYGGFPDYVDPGEGGVNDPVGADSPDAHVLVEFGAIPTTQHKPAHNGGDKKHKAHPTGGGKNPKRDPNKKFHPSDARHTGNTVGKAISGGHPGKRKEPARAHTAGDGGNRRGDREKQHTQAQHNQKHPAKAAASKRHR